MVIFDSRLYDRPGTTGSRRRQIVSVLDAALAAVDPGAAVRAQLRLSDDGLHVAGECYALRDLGRVLVVGAGKAGAPMARAAEEVLGERVHAGCVVVKYGHGAPTERVCIREAGHPLPDEAGVAAAGEIARLLDDAAAADLVLCLISGGGSALMTLPVEGVSLADVQALTDALLRRGATINEINAIRKHLDQLKGGNLARRARPARVVSLILSDVVGNPLDVIASGPTVADETTFADAWRLLERYDLVGQAPAAILAHLQRGLAGEVPDTPKAGDPALARVRNVIVASNDVAARAAERRARELGFNTVVLSTYVEGEAREVAKVMAAIAREEIASGRPLPRPACIIAGGETTVTVRGQGKGGRNQEMALMAATCLDGLEDVAMVCLATDGTDGPTDASGALADGDTLRRARERGLDPWHHLQENDAYPFFAALDDLILTGPTQTNVNDLTLVFAW